MQWFILILTMAVASSYAVDFYETKRCVDFYREDLARILDQFQIETNFVRKTWNQMSSGGLLSVASNEKVVAIYNPNDSNLISQVEKKIFQGDGREDQSQGYTARFYESTTNLQWITRRDGKEIIKYSSKGSLKRYSLDQGNQKWLIVEWDDQGNVRYLFAKDDSKIISKSKQQLQEKGLLPLKQDVPKQ